MIYFQLFLSFFQIGLFSIGGGYATIPLIQNQVVDLHGWLTMEQFSNLLTIAEMTPGAIAINASTFVGTQIAGLGGALVATLGCILPACVIVSFLGWLYYRYRNITVMQDILKGLRPAVVAMITSAGLSIVILSFWGEQGFSFHPADLNLISVALFAVAFVLLRKFKKTPIFVMCLCGVIGMIIYTQVLPLSL